MMESSRAKINLIQLSLQELSSRIALLVSNQNRVVFWKQAPDYFEGYASTFNVKDEVFLKLDKLQVPHNYEGQTLCLNFLINEIDYFIKGKVIFQDQDAITLELSRECYRLENRSRERLVVFPLYDVNVYFTFPKRENPNVIFLNKKNQHNNDFFSIVENAHKKNITTLIKELKINETEDLLGFRVEDISSTGISFFATANEKKLLLDEIKEDKINLMLKFDDEIFRLKEGRFVYKMNYINSQYAGVPVFKIGMSFNPDTVLKRKIEDISGITVDLNNYRKEFEEFIRNE